MEWIDILGYEGLYQVSSDGDVRSLDREVLRRNRYGGITIRKDTGKVLNPGLMGGNTKRGEYKCVCLSNGKGVMHYIHRLVAIAFIPNPDNLPEIDHINQNKLDNNISNLRWIPKNENHLNKYHKIGASGHHNIQYDKRVNTYRVSFTRRPARINIGSFKNIEEAIQARDDYLSIL